MARLGLGLPVCDLLLNTKRTSLSGLTSALSQELGQFHIRVNALVPGYIQTQMIESKLMVSTSSEMAFMCPLFFGPCSFVSNALLMSILGHYLEPYSKYHATAVSRTTQASNGLHLP